MAAALLLMGTAASGQAQQAPAAGEPLKLETVVVSANRRIEKLEDVPQSITVLGEEYMQRNNVREFNDIVNLTPALSISVGTQVGTNSINMRGIGTTSNNLGIEGDIAVIIDDLPYAQPQQAFKDQADVARVEVLKGPQSTMFGKSAIAGAVVMTTKPIGAGPMKTNVSLFRSSDDEYRATAALSGRLSDDVAMRLFASKTNFPGLLNNLTTGRKQNGSGGKSFVTKFLWKVNSDVDVMVTPQYDHSLSTGNTAAITSIDPGVGYLYNKAYTALSNTEVLRGITPSPTNRDIRNDSPSGLESTNRGVGVRVNYQFPERTPLAGHALTSISSVVKNLSNDFRDNDNIDLVSTFYQLNHAGKPSGINAKAEINGTSDSKTSTQEFRLTSPDEGQLRYLVGLWFARNSLFRTYYRGNPFVKETNFTNYETSSSNLNRALYANGSWEFASRNTLTAGVRLNRESNNYMFHTIDSLSSSAPNNIHTGENMYVAPQHDENGITGKLAYTYHFTPDVMAYGSAATGRKGVAYDMTSGANNVNVFKRLPLAAETADSFELGFKANLWNNRATFNAAAFRTRFHDYQTSATERFSDGSQASVLYSIPALQTKGFEADTTVLLTRELQLNASLAFTRATILNWTQGPCYSGATDCTVPNALVPGAFLRDASGGGMPNAPKWKLSTGAEYRLPQGMLPFRTAFNVQWRTQSRVQGAISQDPSLNRPGYGIVDLGASMSDDKGKYKLSVGVKNVADHHYASGNVGSFLNFKKTSGPDIKSLGWQPARDAFRYFTVRLDAAF
ncbi:TonB-dependent receptor [Pseudoduganella aquatica]|uniref:TonB-dependent receptor n=1 Tax=Pseudoduganella aquatica TaxID=2660641 RepID=A0A7X4H8U4_9BURK|nr:TonB-dependent receptor [Pseudoduganella aquatica]MYN06794.1 TonB-dependent receptor [Pseudoduganella aquatica]